MTTEERLDVVQMEKGISSPPRSGPARSAKPQARTKKPRAKRVSGSSRSRDASAGYPKFFRRGNDLIKVGWSDRSDSEYYHHTSYQTISKVVDSLSSLGSDSRLFRIEDQLPGIQAEMEAQIPSYQLYVVMAWLRSEGLVRQHGRQGYSTVRNETLEEQVKERWQALPEAA